MSRPAVDGVAALRGAAAKVAAMLADRSHLTPRRHGRLPRTARRHAAMAGAALAAG
jgi:hypothetical protein